MYEPRLTLLDDWIIAINELIQQYKACGKRHYPCPLCFIENLESEAQGYPEVNDCICPWSVFRKSEIGQTCSRAVGFTPSRNIKRLENWRERIKKMKE